MDHLFAACADQSGFRITTESVLEEESQLRVSERHVGTSVSECFDANTQSCETQIDFLSLLQNCTCCSCFSYSLTACEIDKVQSSLLLRPILVSGREIYHKDGVAS